MRILVIRHGARGRPRADLPHAAARDDPLFTDLPDTIPAFHWHADTFTPPADAILLASSDPYPNQAFLIGAPGYCVRAESNLATIRGDGGGRHYCRSARAGARPGSAMQVLEAAVVHMDAIRDFSRHLAWLDACVDRADTAGTVGERDALTAVASVHTAPGRRFVGEDA